MVQRTLIIRDVIGQTLGPSKLPITKSKTPLIVGYTLVSNIDNITNRQFLATRKLASPENLDLSVWGWYYNG